MAAGHEFLTAPPFREAAADALHPEIRRWFAATYDEPTPAQRHAWPTIARGKNFLLSSPTGSGKTLAAFAPILSAIATSPVDGCKCLYLAPLKALCRDVGVNLKRAWHSIQTAGFCPHIHLRVGLRTGDTSQQVRRRHLRHSPTILLTTPESLAQMLAHGPSHEMLRSVRWLVLDEIHALVGTKRGADVALGMERLQAIAPAEIQRIGLSATCAPLATAADFLVGVDRAAAIASVPDIVEKQFAIEPLFENLDYSPGWINALLDRLERDLHANATTLIFTNTRNLAERVTWGLRRRHPLRLEQIAVHHSAISPARRRAVERRLKYGRLWVVVSSTSLELGIDVGAVDQVVFVHPPGGVVRLLQRVGRSGHRPDQPRRGLLLTASPAELLEAIVTASSGRDGQIERIRAVAMPLDLLCQHLVGMAMTAAWSPDDALTILQRAMPFRALTSGAFRDCLDYLSGRRRDGSAWLPARLKWSAGRFLIADARTARLLRRNLGTILTEDACAIRLRASAPNDDSTTATIGEVDQVYAERLQPGDRFVLEGRCLELKTRAANGLLVEEAFGRPQFPRWLGSGPPLPPELTRRIFLFRAQAAEVLRDGAAALYRWLHCEYRLTDAAITPLADFLAEQETVSEIPTPHGLLVEWVAMQACHEYFLHTPLPRSANGAIARVLTQRRRQLRQPKPLTLAADLGIYVVMPTARPIMADDWRTLLRADGFVDDLRRHLEASDLLAETFARVAQTGLMVLRNPLGRKRKVGGRDWIERRLFEQIREQAPDFFLLRQAVEEAATATCDGENAESYLRDLDAMPIRVRPLARPSPFGEALTGGPNAGAAAARAS